VYLRIGREYHVEHEFILDLVHQQRST
jgi:hypothetical protein